MPKVNQTYKLPDGRMLGYDDHGPPSGKPIFFFHGTPGTRLNWYLFGSEELMQKLNIRIISLDRPGLGLSDFHAGRQFCDWPGDVIALADTLLYEFPEVVEEWRGILAELQRLLESKSQ